MDAAVTADPGAPAALRAKALLGSGGLALLQCDYAPADVAGWRLHCGCSANWPTPRASRARCRCSAAWPASRAGMPGRWSCTGKAWPSPSAGDRWAVANAHNTLGFAAWLQGDFELATAECAAALTMSRELGYVEDIAWSLISLGAIARYQRAHDRAAALLAKSRSRSERIGLGRAPPGRWSSRACWRSTAVTPPPRACCAAASSSIVSCRTAGGSPAPSRVSRRWRSPAAARDGRPLARGGRGAARAGSGP